MTLAFFTLFYGLGCYFGGWLLGCTAGMNWRDDEAVKKGFMRYNEKTGRKEWIDE